MMKEVKNLLLAVVLISLTFALGCQQKLVDQKPEENKGSIEKQKTSDEKNIELEIWSWFSFGYAIKQFEAENKGITVKEKLFDFDKCNEEYMKALANGTGPDVLVFDSSFFGQYTLNNILQNLLEEPYSAEKYKNDFWGWESGYSLDNTQLLSLTYSTAPYITMYREDIMKENGFPYEPEEFGKFIEDPDNLMKIANKLKEQGKYIFQYPTDITELVGASLGYFDEKLNCNLGSEMFIKPYDLAKKAYDKSLVLGKSFWNDGGKSAIQEERLVMSHLGSYAMPNLENYVPEQKGKWRIAKAPLGVAALASDSRLSINIESSHKNEAWKLLQYIVTNPGKIENVVPAYIPAQSNIEYISQKKEFFGNQNIYKIIVDLANDMKQHKLTPLDNKVYDAYNKAIWQSFSETTGSSKEKIEKIKENVEKEIAEEKQSLLE